MMLCRGKGEGGEKLRTWEGRTIRVMLQREGGMGEEGMLGRTEVLGRCSEVGVRSIL